MNNADNITLDLTARCGKATNRRGLPFDAYALSEHERMCKECKALKEIEKGLRFDRVDYPA